MVRTWISSIGLFAVLAAVGGASAQDMASVAVRTSDLDLQTQRGAALLWTRVAVAIREVCGDDGAWPDLVSQREIARCETVVRAGVARQVAAALSAAVDAQRGAFAQNRGASPGSH